MDAFGIERKEIEQIIRKGMKWKDSKREKIWYAQMRGIEVVFCKKNNLINIITVYYAGREK